MQLLHAPGACSLAPHIMLREVGAPFTSIKLNTRDGFPEKYVHLNPKRRVPVLILDDGSAITEVPAILTAIAQIQPERQLLGQSNLEIVRSYEWFNWLSGTVHAQAFGGLWRSGRFTDDETAFEGIKKKARINLENCFADIEEKLGSGHAVGNAFTAVDVYLYVFYRWGNVIGLDMKSKYPHYHAMIEELVKRDSVRVAVQDEGIELMGVPRSE